MVRFVQDPMFPTVQGFGESWSVLVPLNAAPSVANPKRQCYKVRVNARGAGGEFVVAQEGFPFCWTVNGQSGQKEGGERENPKARDRETHALRNKNGRSLSSSILQDVANLGRRRPRYESKSLPSV